MSEERVQKALSRMGFGSRREIEQWIEQGRVQINGKVAVLGDKVSDGDRAEFNGKRIVIRAPKEKVRILIYNKPAGEVCSRKDEQGRKTVFESLPKITNAKWVGVGRLDINTSGLILFTNNGELANRLMHPSNNIEREYAVRIKGKVSNETLKRLLAGVELDDGMAAFEDIQDAGGQGSNHWYKVVLKEGRNREVRRLWEAVDVMVSRLIRVRYGPVSLPLKLRQGKYEELAYKEVKNLMNLVGLKTDKVTTGKLIKKGRKTIGPKKTASKRGG